MYHHYPNSLRPDGTFTSDDVRYGLIALHTDYECPFCGHWQSVPQMGGYGCCIQCGAPSDSSTPSPYYDGAVRTKSVLHPVRDTLRAALSNGPSGVLNKE